MSLENLQNLTVSQLKDLLRERELQVSGKKADLVARLFDYGIAEDQIPEPAKKPRSKAGKSKKKKDPAASVKSAIRDADLSLGEMISLMVELYDFPESVIEQVDPDQKPEPVPIPDTEDELKSFKVAELKKILKSRNQKTTGKKKDLIQRLLNPEPEPEEKEQVVEGEETYDSLKKLKVKDLKSKLKERNQKVSGKKEDLIQRLLNPEPEPEPEEESEEEEESFDYDAETEYEEEYPDILEDDGAEETIEEDILGGKITIPECQ